MCHMKRTEGHERLREEEEEEDEEEEDEEKEVEEELLRGKRD